LVDAESKQNHLCHAIIISNLLLKGFLPDKSGSELTKKLS